ncbi:helix-turn-helix domain-containing protein [Exiguobacterium undae]|uniref:helix-turn-helix domain-containing protein n=1 Tax=Exiguobacterium undae TaxID=169177 RepID=UPI00047A1133|nr:helix-turn-helix transcriptional regulator [Exiguobacterium undae]
MTGEQLGKFISMLDILLKDFEENFPELRNEVLEKRRHLTVLEKITEEERNKKEHKELENKTASYALTIINKILISDKEVRYLDYSPMYGLMARYGIKLSNLCDYLGISTNVRTSISKNESVHMDILIQIAEFLECEPNDLYTLISSSEKEKREMKESLVKESQRLLFREKLTPIPHAIIRELRETDKPAASDYLALLQWKNDDLINEYYHDYNYAPSPKWLEIKKRADKTMSSQEQIKNYLAALVKEIETKKDENKKED